MQGSQTFLSLSSFLFVSSFLSIDNLSRYLNRVLSACIPHVCLASTNETPSIACICLFPIIGIPTFEDEDEFRHTCVHIQMAHHKGLKKPRIATREGSSVMHDDAHSGTHSKPQLCTPCGNELRIFFSPIVGSRPPPSVA